MWTPLTADARFCQEETVKERERGEEGMCTHRARVNLTAILRIRAIRRMHYRLPTELRKCLCKRELSRTQAGLGRALKEEQEKILATMCKDLFSALWSAVGRVGASAKKGKCAESDGEGKTLGESERVGGRMDERSGALARCRDN